jgi:type II secretory pathway pseudopilin PulG
MNRMVQPSRAAFTLLEVMIAVAFIGIALMALLSLHHTDLQSVIRAQELTRAAMLAQALMTEAELERFPAPDQSGGDFSRMYPGQYPGYRWQRVVAPVDIFPDVCRVDIRVLYGPKFSRTFSLTEYIHNPMPPPMPNQPQQNGGAPAAPPGAGALQ